MIEKKTEEILFIIGCSSRKAEIELPVKDFYKGQLFLMLKRLCKQNSFDYCLISGKLGLLKPNDFVKPYNMQIKTKKDVLRVRELTNYKLEREIKKYDKIIVLMGKKYRDVITPLINDRFTIITDEKGIFGYLTKVSSYLKQTKKEFLNSIKKYEVKKMYDCEIGRSMNAESMNHKVDLSICAVSGCKEHIYAEVQVFDQSTACLCKKHSEAYPKEDIIKIL